MFAHLREEPPNGVGPAHASKGCGSEPQGMNANIVTLFSDHPRFISSLRPALFLSRKGRKFWCERRATLPAAHLHEVAFRTRPFTDVQRRFLASEKDATTAGDDTLFWRRQSGPTFS
jgi:hypothetical protein